MSSGSLRSPANLYRPDAPSFFFISYEAADCMLLALYIHSFLVSSLLLLFSLLYVVLTSPPPSALFFLPQDAPQLNRGPLLVRQSAAVLPPPTRLPCWGN